MSKVLIAIAASIPLVRAQIAFYDPSMWGFNVTMQDYLYDDRPMVPLQEHTFGRWWFHGHLDYPPEPGNFFELPAGGFATSQLACNKGATKWRDPSEGRFNIRQGDSPCPGSKFHGIDNLRGCALSIAYTSDVNSVKPEDLAIFSVNHQCVKIINTLFQVPQDMPPCPDDGCICAWHWIHSVDSGSAQMYMNGFRCKVTGSTSNYPIMMPQVPRRCTGDLPKCNQGAQQPLYYFQAEGTIVFGDQYDPPSYLDEWGFTDGAQNNIFGKGGNNNSTITAPLSSSSSFTPPTSAPPISVNPPAPATVNPLPRALLSNAATIESPDPPCKEVDCPPQSLG